MRLLILLVMSLVVLTLACTGGGESSQSTTTPEPSALQIWARTLTALERVQSVRLKEGLYKGVFPREGRPSKPGHLAWQTGQPLPGFPYSPLLHHRPPSLTNLRLLGQEPVKGKPAWVVSFDGSVGRLDDVYDYTAKAWVLQHNYLVSRIEIVVTRSEGVEPLPPGTSLVLEYSDYVLGAPTTPEPAPTPTPSAEPEPKWVLEPTSGPCNASVFLQASGLPSNTVVTISKDWRYFTEGEELKLRDPHQRRRADGSGFLEAELQLAEDKCAAQGVAVWRGTIWVNVNADDVRGFGITTLKFSVEPCRELTPEAVIDLYCYAPPLIPAP